MYPEVCKCQAQSCLHGKQKFFNDIVKDATQWVYYFERESITKWCICKHRIDRVFKIVNKVTGDEAYVGSSCINRIFNVKQNFNINDKSTKPKQLFYNDTRLFMDNQIQKQNNIFNKIKDQYQVNILSCEKNYLIYGPFVLYYCSKKNERPKRLFVKRQITINKFLYERANNIENIEYIKQNTTTVSKQLWFNSIGKTYKSDIPVQTSIRLNNELENYPELMDSFIYRTKNGKEYEFKDIVEWNESIKQNIANYNCVFQLYIN